MKTITVASGKGGVGKTVIAASLGRILSGPIGAGDAIRGTRVLMLDLDLHGRGLTYLFYPGLQALRECRVSIEWLLEGWQSGSSWEELARGLDEIGREWELLDGALMTLPASVRVAADEARYRLQYSWSPQDVSNMLGEVLWRARESGIDFTIIDTGAGADDLSLPAVLLSDATWLVLEQDRISWRSSLHFIALAQRYLGEVHPLEKPYIRERLEFLFLPNKTTRGFRPEVQELLSTYDFLPAIPLDISFLETYLEDPFSAMTGEVLRATRFGESMIRAVRHGMQATGVDSEVIEDLTRTYAKPSLASWRSKVYRQSDRVVPLFLLAVLLSKWIFQLLLARGSSTETLALSAMSDLVMLGALLLLAGRRVLGR